MRVEHDGRYAAVASKAGFPRHPVWYFDVRSDPHVELQDGSTRQGMTAREITGDEKAEWWKRAVAAYPPYAEYQEKTDRVIRLRAGTRVRGRDGRRPTVVHEDLIRMAHDLRRIKVRQSCRTLTQDRGQAAGVPRPRCRGMSGLIRRSNYLT